MQRRVVLEPRSPRLPDQRRRGEKAGAPALLVDPQFGSDDDVEQGLDRPSQRPHHPGNEDRGVTGGAMVPNPAYGFRREPAQDVGGHRRIDETFQGGQISASIAAVDRAQEGAAVSLLGPQVRGKSPHHLANLGKLTCE